MALFLSDDLIRGLVSMEDMIQAIETMQRRFARGEAFNVARRKVVRPGAELATMGGGLFYDNVFGVKSYTVVGGKYSFHTALYDSATGKLLAFLQANRLGQLRTGATTGVAVNHLALPEAATVGIIGTGLQAPSQLEGVCKVRHPRTIKAYSPSKEHRHEFAIQMTTRLGIQVTDVDSSQEAVEESDIVVCITTAVEPVLDGRHLKPGALLVSAGPTLLGAREVDEESIKRAGKIVVDSLEQAPYESGELALAQEKGLIQWSQPVELRYIVAGMMDGRDSYDQIIFAKLMGTGVADVAAAKLVYDAARVRGVGEEVDF